MFRHDIVVDYDKVIALTSFAYNLGIYALQESRLRVIVNEPKFIRDTEWMVRVALEWVDWSNKTVGGERRASAGLVDRRRREAALFCGVSLG